EIVDDERGARVDPLEILALTDRRHLLFGASGQDEAIEAAAMRAQQHHLEALHRTLLLQLRVEGQGFVEDFQPDLLPAPHRSAPSDENACGCHAETSLFGGTPTVRPPPAGVNRRSPRSSERSA